MTDTCSKHSFEPAAGVCQQCCNSYCDECLIFAFGPKKPPYCVTCALSAAGVRRKGAKINPRLQKKGLFGKRVVAEEEPVHELGFNDVKIELPSEASDSPATYITTRREVSPELVAAVSAADATFEAPAYESVGVATQYADDPSTSSLADWAESLDSGVSSSEVAEPGVGIAEWPEYGSDSGSSF